MAIFQLKKYCFHKTTVAKAPKLNIQIPLHKRHLWTDYCNSSAQAYWLNTKCSTIYLCLLTRFHEQIGPVNMPGTETKVLKLKLLKNVPRTCYFIWWNLSSVLCKNTFATTNTCCQPVKYNCRKSCQTQLSRQTRTRVELYLRLVTPSTLQHKSAVYPSRPSEDGFAHLDRRLWKNARLTPVFL